VENYHKERQKASKICRNRVDKRFFISNRQNVRWSRYWLFRTFGYRWRIRYAVLARLIILANNGCLVVATGTSFNQLLSRAALTAVAVSTFCKCVFAAPMYLVYNCH